MLNYLKEIFATFILTASIVSCTSKEAENIRDPEFRNFYGIAWNGTPHENLAYARQMGYDYVFYQEGMENDSLSNGLYFYLESPEYDVYERRIITNQEYTEEEIEFYNSHCAIKDTGKAFPDNIARGWFRTPYNFSPELDFQQLKVIHWAIDSILGYVQSIEDKNPQFKFGGYAWDVPQPPGDFWDTLQSAGGSQITLAHWTGGDFGYAYPGIVHDFKTYSDGRIEFYKRLYAATEEIYPYARFMMEPYRIYGSWLEHIIGRDDAAEVMPDLLAQERHGTEFVDDDRIFETGLIEKENIASTTPNTFGHDANTEIAAKAAINGAWFSWYGRFGGTGDMPRYQSVKEVPDRLKLIRMLAIWENIHQTPLSERKWNGTTYKSPTAFVGPGQILISHPDNSNLYLVPLTDSAKIYLPEGFKLESIWSTDDLLKETENAMMYFDFKENYLELKPGIELDEAYIIKSS